jgi:hypothetical protein
MRDVYAVAPENPQFAMWRETGQRDGPESDYWRDWVATIRRAVSRGVTVRRARIVSEPVTEYIRFEHAGTFVNVAAGEDVRWLPRHRAADIALPGTDFWLFDDKLIRFGHFSGDGHVTSHELADSLPTVTLCSMAFETAWARATPHEQYEI